MSYKNMTMDQAIEIVKWGPRYVRPPATDIEFRQATRMVLNCPERWNEIMQNKS